MHHVIGCQGLFESRAMKIDYGIINVEVQGIFGIGCLSCYRGISGFKRVIRALKSEVSRPHP